MTENPDRDKPADSPAPSAAAQPCIPDAAAARTDADGWAATIRSFRWPLVIVLLAVLGVYLACRTLRTGVDALGQAPRAAREVMRGAAELAGRFKSGKITTTFVAAIPQLAPAANLEVATLEATETFSRKNEKRIFWDAISLGTTITEIKVPVTYRYHVPLGGRWRLDVRDHTCIVVAPPIRPDLPPAIHTDRMQKKARSGWLRFNAREQMEALERNITPILKTYAMDQRHLDMVREHCRRGVARFVRMWLLKEDHWRRDRFSAIKVIFADEADVEPANIEPAARLEDGADGE